MRGYFSLLLHAHLPFVRHPEHEKFLEESWLNEAITETYIPLLQTLDGWRRDAVPARITLSLSPTLCAMFNDALLRERYARHLENLLELAARELHRTRWDNLLHALAKLNQRRLVAARETYDGCKRDLVGAFRKFQDDGLLEIITCAATHAILPLLNHEPSVRAQILVARESHRKNFGRDPRGIWLPECAYTDSLGKILREAELRWFVVDTHGLLRAKPKPHYGIFAPVFTSEGVAAFGRDRASAEQVWSRLGGYPGDPRYRDFYRDIGFELDFEYVKPCLPAPHIRGFTGIKYHRITGPTQEKQIYDRTDALSAADAHAQHFLDERVKQFRALAQVMDRPAHVIAPYDAELFGHWWHEGMEFLDLFVRKAAYDQKEFSLATPTEFLERQPTHQIATPADSSWGEEGGWRVWLNEKNQWVWPRLRAAQEKMTALAEKFSRKKNGAPVDRALSQAGRELLLAQASDWPFILHSGTHADYARSRVEAHLENFHALHAQLLAGKIAEETLARMESRGNIFPGLDWRCWQARG
jgi:1,4-alpha-glucan branching enzyme